MKLNFDYSVESEYSRVLYTLSKCQFYIENGYKVSVPVGVDTTFLNKDKEEELKRIISSELEEDKVQEFVQILSNKWDDFGVRVEGFLKSLPYENPNEIFITFTKYGTGGSYGVPNRIICNIRSIRDIFETSVHELIHCIIEIPVVVNFNLTHLEKESLVEYLIIENLHDIFPDYTYRNDNKPSYQLLKKVGWVK